MPIDLNHTIQLIPNKPTYLALSSLKQFNVINVTIHAFDEMSKVNVDILLRRIFTYHLTNTFMPTITLLVIAEVTLHFDESKTELAIGLSLTIMLVMYTMYQSISESLIKTAYLKMIDYWLLFCLLMPFFIFMIEIYWLLLMQQKPQTEKGWFMAQKGHRKPQRSSGHRKLIQLAVHGITLFCIFVYASAASMVYF